MSMTLAQTALWLCGLEDAMVSYDRDGKCSWLIPRDDIDDEYGYVLCNGEVTRWNVPSESFVTVTKIRHRLEAFNDNVRQLTVRHSRANALAELGYHLDGL